MKRHKARTREQFTKTKLQEWCCPAGRDYVIYYARQVEHLGLYIGKSGRPQEIHLGRHHQDQRR
jgi:hypothetical protein